MADAVPPPVSDAPLLRLLDIRKTYRGSTAPALDGVSIEVRPGEIFGIIGRSGAGKSSLVRCVNMLERPDSGQVLLAGQDLGRLGRDDLAAARRGMGMVFQHFNLLASRTVAGNIALPLEIAGTPAAARRERVKELLHLVGLEDRADAYPAQLSGGQKQRVGIARALATNPTLLLSDEATSALDPETTAEILALIRELRDRLRLTVLLITHEMEVVKAICDRVAVLERGRVIEQGRVFDVFTRPQSDTARQFAAQMTGEMLPKGTVARLPEPRPGEVRRILRILFTSDASTRAVISEASRRFGLDLNIISGRIDAIGMEPFGVLVVAAFGDPAHVAQAIDWMRGLELEVDDIAAATAGSEVA